MEKTYTYITPKGTKSMNKLLDDGKYFCWVDSAGGINLPGDDSKLTNHKFVELPEDIQALTSRFWTEKVAATVDVVDIEGEHGVALNFPWTFGEWLLSRIPSSNPEETVKNAGIAFAEWMVANAPTGINIYYWDGIASGADGDEIVAFIPWHLCPALLGDACKNAVPLIEHAWKKANDFLGIPMKFSFHNEVVTTIPTWALIENIQHLRKALSEVHFSSYMSMQALKEEAWLVVECLEQALANSTRVPDGLDIKPSSSSLIAPGTKPGIIARLGGYDIECAAGKPISHAMAGGVCQCDKDCPHYKKCFDEDGNPRDGVILPMQMPRLKDWNSNSCSGAIVQYLEKNL